MGTIVGTCSIENLRENCLTFARSKEFLDLLGKAEVKVTCIVDEKLADSNSLESFPKNIDFIVSKYPDYDFTVIHNEIYKNNLPDEDQLHAGFHPSSQIDEGIHVALGSEGKRLQLKHMGNVIMEPGSRVGPLTFIQRASLPGCSTVIKAGALVDGYCTLGHNVVIGEGTAVAAGSIVGAGTVIGKNCLIGIQTVIRPHTKICDRVVTGIGSLVLKDLDRPGIYFGNPAVFKKDHPPGWMW